MDGDLQKYLQPEYRIENGDMKYVSGLSTILVATIQEAKDRISQIEYIFCSQLFPNFQLNCKSLQKSYTKARKAAEDLWKEKENDLLLQIENLHLKNKQAIEENRSLKQMIAKLNEVAEERESRESLLKLIESKDSMIHSNEKLLREHEEKNNTLLKKQRVLQLEAEELQKELIKKSKEVDAGMELQNKLLQLVQSKTSSVVGKEKQLKEHEEKITELLAKLKGLEEGVGELQQELREKTKEVERETEFKETLLTKIESQSSKIVYYEQLLNSYEKEKELLTTKLESFKQNADDLDKEKKLLLAKQKGLEEKVDKLQMQLRVKSSESSEGIELHGKLLQQIEMKESELLSEKKKRKDVIDAYKNLKSQYNFLRTKFGLTQEKMLPQNRTEDGNGSSRNYQNPLTSPNFESKVEDPSGCEITKQKDDQENTEDHKGVRSIKRASSDSPANSASPVVLKCPTNEKPPPLVGSKRSVSHWRGTRSNQDRGGPDPHGDFLDTPLENIRGNLKKAVKEEVNDLPGPVPKNMILDSSDDVTQDMNVDPGPQKQQMPPPRPGTRGFKFVEPVRKKAERENLKGVECKQCKNFYDAVLPDGGGEENKQNLRCEHHEGVSRHRYRYAPPLTPEGFWNIGFESEM